MIRGERLRSRMCGSSAACSCASLELSDAIVPTNSQHREYWTSPNRVMMSRMGQKPHLRKVRFCEGLRTPAPGNRGAVITGRHPKTLYGAIIVKLHLRSFRSPCSTQVATISSSRPNFDWLPRAVTVKGWPQAIAKQLALDGHEHGGRLARSVELCDDNSRGARHRARRSRHNLVFGRSVRIGTMMQSCASAAKLRSGGPILHSGLVGSHGFRRRVTATSDRHLA